jgi:endonuclease/exonuclease/phosphatase family metal-dependent hydrolase
VYGLHLTAVHSNWTEQLRIIEVRALLREIARREQGFHLLMGDFNTLAPGERLDVRQLPPRLRPFVWLGGGRIRWRAIQLILDHGYSDGFRLFHPGDPGFTFPSWSPHVRLDYAFVPAAFAGRLKSCDVIDGKEATEASDHFPLRAALELD